MSLNNGWSNDLREISVWSSGIWKNTLQADWPLDIESIVLRAQQWEWKELEALESTITFLREWTRYIETPEDALRLVWTFSREISEGISAEKVLWILHIVSEFVSNQNGYDFWNWDHIHVNNVYANKAIITETTLKSLDDPWMHIDTERLGDMTLTQPTELATKINAFLNVAGTHQRTLVQKAWGVLAQTLWFEDTSIVDWNKIIYHADTYVKSLNN